MVTLAYRLADDDKKDAGRFLMTFGGGLRNAQDGGRHVPLSLDLDLSPCAFLAHAHEDNARCTISNGELAFQDDCNKKDLLRIARQTDDSWSVSELLQRKKRQS